MSHSVATFLAITLLCLGHVTAIFGAERATVADALRLVQAAVLVGAGTIALAILAGNK